MRIPQDERPAPWFNRRDQYRMLALVGLLCLVMVAIKFAAQPSSWHWLLPPVAPPGEAATDRMTLRELDFRVKQEDREPLPPDVFRAVADETDVAEASNTVQTSGAAPQQTENDPAIAPDVLSGIEDNTIGVRRAEVEAYHTMLDRVRQLPGDVLRAESDNDVAFTVIMLQPDDYRGRLIGITGQLVRLRPFPVMENDRGIDQLYEGWLLTEDSGNNPWRFVCTQIPRGVDVENPGLPRRVRVQGYFFKRMGYASEGGQHVAPTLLAHSFDVLPAPVSAAPEMQAQMRNVMLGLMGLVIVALAGLIWWFVAADRRYAGSRMHELAVSRLDADPEQLQALSELDTHDPDRPFDDQHVDR